MHEEQSIVRAPAEMNELAKAGVVMSDVTDKLLTDGLSSFQKSFESLTQGLEKKVSALV